MLWPFPHRRKDKGRRHKQPESKLQVLCVNYAKQGGLLVVGSAAGAWYANGAMTAMAMKARGVESGSPDLLILEAGANGAHGLAIELKIGRNALSDLQRDWFARARVKGWRCEVVRGETPEEGLTAFIRVVCEHLGSSPGSSTSPIVL